MFKAYYYILFTGNVYLGVAELDLLITFVRLNLFPLTACIWGEGGGDTLQIGSCYVQTFTGGKRDKLGHHHEHLAMNILQTFTENMKMQCKTRVEFTQNSGTVPCPKSRKL